MKLKGIFVPAYMLLAICIVTVSFLTSVYVTVVNYNYSVEEAWHKTIAKGYGSIVRDMLLFIAGYMFLALFLMGIFRNGETAQQLAGEIAWCFVGLIVCMLYPII